MDDERPMVATTYYSSMPETRPVTLIDNVEQPEVLITLRSEIEELLNISALIR